MKKVQLVLIKDIYEFVDICVAAKTPVRLHQGYSVIDGRSILGVLSLSWLTPVTIEVENGDYSPFEKFIVEE